ncbi:MAG: hypothetical protein ACTTJH_06235 [Bacteroidales bacterium]
MVCDIYGVGSLSFLAVLKTIALSTEKWVGDSSRPNPQRIYLRKTCCIPILFFPFTVPEPLVKAVIHSFVMQYPNRDDGGYEKYVPLLAVFSL